ncbi:YppF family protein [Oceanobacillus bengalensis]|uniref:Uncharacterized protein n=1 Tax=Oceanobacillus bengalensis TaxID=1435466 RepID=A0A494Z8A1_9BACI|nr:YppF family protein [Oceanobacillus bengalensis]RKQ18840.1 hypothetical protein D8M05_01660 [Oceanobacillus bengalensis]
MHIHDLVDRYIKERKYSPDSINDILDFYQQKYISGEIGLNNYKSIFSYLHKQGAISAYDYDVEQFYQKSY